MNTKFTVKELKEKELESVNGGYRPEEFQWDIHSPLAKEIGRVIPDNPRGEHYLENFYPLS